MVQGVGFYNDLSIGIPLNKNGRRGEGLLQGIEEVLALLSLGSRHGLASETCERDSDVQVVWDETTIEVGKAEERLYIHHFLGHRPFEDGINLVQGHTKTFGGEYKAKILNRISVELTFVWPDI
jgi:hypothetical protein